MLQWPGGLDLRVRETYITPSPPLLQYILAKIWRWFERGHMTFCKNSSATPQGSEVTLWVIYDMITAILFQKFYFSLIKYYYVYFLQMTHAGIF